MLMSMSTCTAQFNSILTATCSLRLVDMTGKGREKGMRGGNCEETDTGRGLWRQSSGEGMRRPVGD